MIVKLKHERVKHDSKEGAQMNSLISQTVARDKEFISVYVCDVILNLSL